MLVEYVGPHDAVQALGYEFKKGEPVLVNKRAFRDLTASPLFREFVGDAPESVNAEPSNPEYGVNSRFSFLEPSAESEAE